MWAETITQFIDSVLMSCWTWTVTGLSLRSIAHWKVEQTTKFIPVFVSNFNGAATWTEHFSFRNKFQRGSTVFWLFNWDVDWFVAFVFLHVLNKLSMFSSATVRFTRKVFQQYFFLFSFLDFWSVRLRKVSFHFLTRFGRRSTLLLRSAKDPVDHRPDSVYLSNLSHVFSVWWSFLNCFNRIIRSFRNWSINKIEQNRDRRKNISLWLKTNLAIVPSVKSTLFNVYQRFLSKKMTSNFRRIEEKDVISEFKFFFHVAIGLFRFFIWKKKFLSNHRKLFYLLSFHRW